MSKINTHWLNLALNLWNNSRATAKNLTRPANLDAFRKYYFGLVLICISIPCNSDTPVFDVARFSADPKTIVPQFQPVADHMANLMQSFGYESGNVQILSGLDHAREAFREGGLDTLTCGIYEAAELMRTGDVTPLAVKWNTNIPEYSSLIIVSADSDIFELSDLVGKSIGFEDPASTSAYFMAYKEIVNQGLPITDEAEPNDPNSTIRLRFTGSEQNSSALLYQSKIDAIAISDFDWLKSDHLPQNRRGDFRIIWISPPFPRAVELVRASMPEHQKLFMKNHLVRLHLSQELEEQDLLLLNHRANKFTALQPDDLEQLDELISFIEQQSALR